MGIIIQINYLSELKMIIKSPEIAAPKDAGFQFYVDSNGNSNTANLNSTVQELKKYHKVTPTSLRMIYSYHDEKPI